MLRLSKKMMFAIEAVLDIAYHSSAEPVQSRDITRRQGIPRRYLEQALQHLVRNGLLIGVRGANAAASPSATLSASSAKWNPTIN